MNREPKVALQMLSLVPGAMGGSERYARALTRELAGIVGVSVTAVLPEQARGFSEAVPEEVVRGVRGGPRAAQRLMTLARAELQRGQIHALRSADVVHFPFSTPVPRTGYAGAVVQTLHDVQHLDLPEFFSHAERQFRRVMYDRPARRASVVITTSEFNRARMMQHLGISAQAVEVIGLGVDLPGTVRAGGREDFVLYPARGWRHKNHERLVIAMDLVRRRRPTLRLVLTGGGLDRLKSLPPWVTVLGRVADAELDRLYRTAGLLVFPSLYEGFGMPPLEAMARGCPVAASAAGALPETCGSAAVFFDPMDPRSIADGIERAMLAPEHLISAGYAQARRFTWRACAERHVAVYRRLAAERRQ